MAHITGIKVRTLKVQQYHQMEASVPLKKSTSKTSFRKNVAAEVKAGKPVKQSVAIAYSVKRKAASKKGKMK